MMFCMRDSAYGDSLLLSDLLPSVGTYLGVSAQRIPPIDLIQSNRYVIVLVDGLGWEILVRALSHAPYLSGLIGDAAKLEVGTPTTTATSLMSLWTGVGAGRHGVVGFSFETGGRTDVPRGVTVPLGLTRPLRTAPSYLDRLVDDGIEVSSVMPAEHCRSGLTVMGTRRANLIGADDDDHRIPAIVEATQRGLKSLVYAYEPRLDHAGHGHGVASDSWIQALELIDTFLGDLREELDDDVCLLVTGDHGMVDVPPPQRINIDEEPILNQGLRLIGGEARFRHLYTDEPAAVKARWVERLGDEAEVLTRDEAIQAGLFGKVKPRYLTRIGDVVASPTGSQAYLASLFPGEFSLVGFHGARTSAERFVPLMID